jgi:hypothetical protein
MRNWGVLKNNFCTLQLQYNFLVYIITNLTTTWKKIELSLSYRISGGCDTAVFKIKSTYKYWKLSCLKTTELDYLYDE